MIKNIQKLTNSLNKKVDNLTARLERASSGNNIQQQQPPPCVSEDLDGNNHHHRGYYYQHPPYNYPPPPQHYYGAPPPPPPPQHPAEYAPHHPPPPPPPGAPPHPPPPPHANVPIPPQLPLPEPVKRPSEHHHLPMAYAGYPDAAVEATVGNGSPILPPHANTPSPPAAPAHLPPTPSPPPPHAHQQVHPPKPQRHSPQHGHVPPPPPPPRPHQTPNNCMAILTPPPDYASIADKHAFILKISTIATVASCGDLGVQPWFCVLRMDNDNVAGVSEEYHANEESLLRANFGSIGLPTEGSAAQLVEEFTLRNRPIFEGYHCEIRPGTPAVLVERFGNYHRMVDIYFAQAVAFANNAMKFANESELKAQSNRDPVDVGRGPRVDPEQLPTLKFAAAKDGSFQHVVDTVRKVKRVE